MPFSFSSVCFPWAFLQIFRVESASEQHESGCYGIVDRRGCGSFGCLALFWKSSTLNQFNSNALSTWFIPFPSSTSLPSPFCQRRCNNTPPTLAMDLPQTSSSANDIFSISDQTLANRLQFIEEVHMPLSRSNPAAPLTCPSAFYRLVTGTGEACGDVALSLTLPPNHHPTSMRRSSSLLSSYIGPRPKLPPLESARCACLSFVPLDYHLHVFCFSWNEMKVVRSLKNETHPSIIPFYSFIITPSYALITM